MPPRHSTASSRPICRCSERSADWLDTALLNLPSERVRSVTVTHPDGETVRVSKASSEQANFTVEAIPEGRSLLYESVANVMASVLENMALEDVERAVPDDTSETVTEIATFDGLSLTVRGLAREDGSWVSITADSAAVPQIPAQTETTGDASTEASELNARLDGWRFRIPGYKFQQLTRRMDDLLQAQP